MLKFHEKFQNLVDRFMLYNYLIHIISELVEYILL